MGRTGIVEFEANQPKMVANEQAAPVQMSSSQRDKTNPFLLAATPLMTLMTQVHQCDTPPNVDALYEQVVAEVNVFVEKLMRLGFAKTTVDCAAYCLCAAIDEAVLARDWGTQSRWVQHSLLSIFKTETWGGERFYAIADQLSREPRKYIYVLEMIYVLLSLGFEGRFYGKQRMVRDEVRNRLFHIIRQSRGKIEKALSVNWRDSKPQEQHAKKKNRVRRFISITTLLIIIVGFSFNFLAYEQAKPVFRHLAEVGKESPVTAYSQLVDRSLFPKQYN